MQLNWCEATERAYHKLQKIDFLLCVRIMVIAERRVGVNIKAIASGTSNRRTGNALRHDGRGRERPPIV